MCSKCSKFFYFFIRLKIIINFIKENNLFMENIEKDNEIKIEDYTIKV